MLSKYENRCQYKFTWLRDIIKCTQYNKVSWHYSYVWWRCFDRFMHRIISDHSRKRITTIISWHIFIANNNIKWSLNITILRYNT